MSQQDLANLLLNPNYYIFLRKAGKYFFPPNYYYPQHTHDEIEIVVVQSGYCITEINQQKIITNPNECLIIYSNVQHDFTIPSSQECTAFQLEFHLTGLEKQSSQLLFFEHLFQNLSYETFQNGEDIGNCIFRIGESRHQKDLVQIHFLELYTRLSQHLEVDTLLCPMTEHLKFNQILEHLHRHFPEKLDLEQICQQYQISSRHFRKLCQQKLGTNPVSYLTQLRIDSSKKLLANLSMSISEVAKRSGFSSQQYYSLSFKEQTGVSPSVYRKNLFNDLYQQEERFY